MATRTPSKDDRTGAKPRHRKVSRPADKAAEENKDKKREVRKPTPNLPMYNDGMLNTAIKAARAAAKIQLKAFYGRGRFEIVAKTANDFVTEIDKQCEQEIVDILSKAYPEHRFLGEEFGDVGDPNSEYQWVIDPLDGTTNFIHGIDQFAVSIACLKGKQPIHAVVYDSPRNQLFTATRGKGATLDGKKIRVSGNSNMKSAIIGTGFPFRETDDFDAYLRIMGEMMQKTAGLRRPGSAALDLCWLACGRYDAFWEKGIKIWDIAAAALIAQEAGAIVTDFQGDGNYLKKGEVLAASPKLFPQLLNIIQKNLK